MFLTNTLEPIHPEPNFLLPAITEEAKAAQEVKEKKILVITGNPPYSYQSRNTGAWITGKMAAYRVVDGKPLKERVTQGLLDDYVKFIRFAQLKMDDIDEGIVGVITNHSWLDNPTFPGMRQSLMNTFQQIYVLDLHGNAKKEERAPDGGKDENVFDIEQGVAISLFVKKKGIEQGVWRHDIWGKRLDKYATTAEENLSKLKWQRVNPDAPFYLFVRQDVDLRAAYNEGISIRAMFREGGSGMMTNRDSLTIHFTPESIWSTVTTLNQLSETEAKAKFKLGKEARDWTLARAKADISESGPQRVLIAPVQYRPFDTRFTYHTGRARGFIGWPVEDVWKNLNGENIALVVSRLTKGEKFAHALVSLNMVEKIALSSKTSNNAFVFPLRINDGAENISPDFRAYIDARYPEQHYSPEEILGYIYAVLHAPTYRTKYAEFLRIDFPRIPFPEKQADFDTLSDLGWDLVQAHLLKEVPRQGLAQFEGTGDYTVEKVSYAEAEEAIAINVTQRFRPVPKPVWEFHVGGYQVLEKYLKSRKGRKLSLAEIDHIAEVADALAFTIDQMGRIDEAYKHAFGG